jgi:hypothetical protein
LTAKGNAELFTFEQLPQLPLAGGGTVAHAPSVLFESEALGG